MEWHHGIQLWVGVGTTADEGRAHVARGMTKCYNLDFSLFEKYTPIGNAQQIADYLAPFVEAGATTLNLTPCGANPEIELDTIAEVKQLLS